MSKPIGRGGRRKGAGRPALPKSQRKRDVSFPACPADIRDYDRAAKKAGLTRSAWIRRTLALEIGL